MKKKTKRLFYIYLFCYVFSFYILVFPASMLIAIPLFFCVCTSRTWLKEFLGIWGMKFISRTFLYLLFICTVTFFYTFIYWQFDWSLLTVLYTQIVHLVCALFFFTFMRVHKITFIELCDAFVNIFVVQTLIEIVCCMNPLTLGNWVRFFNHYDSKTVAGIGSNVRGYALSAATTYHLSLSYGVAFIIYIKRLIETEKVTFIKLLQGSLVVIGIFFAGRTGFVGVGIAGLYFLGTFHASTKQKITAILKLSILLTVIISSFLAIAPKNLRGMVVDNLIPYAFEFVYSKFDSGKAETASTNQLKRMWERDFDEMELLLGSGKYMDTAGKHYYMHVDPGILRHLLYGGILFYLILILYQCELTLPYKKRKDYFIFVLMFLYFFLMDFKGVTIGVNKFAFYTSLLFSFGYLYLDYDHKTHFLGCR